MAPSASTLHSQIGNPLTSFPPNYFHYTKFPPSINGNFLFSTFPPKSLSSTSPHSPQSTTSRRVTTVPVEYTSPTPPEFDFESEVSRMKCLKSKLSTAMTLDEKHHVIDTDARVKRFFNSRSGRGEFDRVLEAVSVDKFELFLIKCVVAAGQEHVIGCYGGGGDDVAVAVEERDRSTLKSALYKLVEMIERWDMVGEGVGESNIGVRKQVEGFEKLLKILKDLEVFYDCIGGILG